MRLSLGITVLARLDYIEDLRENIDEQSVAIQYSLRARNLMVEI